MKKTLLIEKHLQSENACLVVKVFFVGYYQQKQRTG